MPWLPFYASEREFGVIREHLNASTEIAFLVSGGPGKWTAVNSVAALNAGRHCLWHIPSGPLPLLKQAGEEDGLVLDPFAGWVECRTGAEPDIPYFGPGHPGVLWLNLRAETTSAGGGRNVGLSSFEWIGNHYKILGQPAPVDTERYWKALRKWVTTVATKVPRGGPSEPTQPEIWAFPGSQALFAQGARGGNV